MLGCLQELAAARQAEKAARSSRIEARLREAAARRAQHLEMIKERAALGAAPGAATPGGMHSPRSPLAHGGPGSSSYKRITDLLSLTPLMPTPGSEGAGAGSSSKTTAAATAAATGSTLGGSSSAAQGAGPAGAGTSSWAGTGAGPAAGHASIMGSPAVERTMGVSGSGSLALQAMTQSAAAAAAEAGVSIGSAVGQLRSGDRSVTGAASVKVGVPVRRWVARGCVGCHVLDSAQAKMPYTQAVTLPSHLITHRAGFEACGGGQPSCWDAWMLPGEHEKAFRGSL